MGDAATTGAPRPALRELLTRSSLAAITVVVAVLGGAVGDVAVELRPDVYAAQTAVTLDQPLTISQSQDAGVVDKLSRLRLKYAGVLRSDEVVGAVATSTGQSAGTVRGALFTGQDPASLLLFIGARAGSPRLALRLANAYAQQLQQFVQHEQTSNAIAPRDRLTLDILVPARYAAHVSPTRRQRLVGAVGAAVVAALLVLGLAALPRRRR